MKPQTGLIKTSIPQFTHPKTQHNNLGDSKTFTFISVVDVNVQMFLNNVSGKDFKKNCNTIVSVV